MPIKLFKLTIGFRPISCDVTVTRYTSACMSVCTYIILYKCMHLIPTIQRAMFSFVLTSFDLMAVTETSI